MKRKVKSVIRNAAAKLLLTTSQTRPVTEPRRDEVYLQCYPRMGIFRGAAMQIRDLDNVIIGNSVD